MGNTKMYSSKRKQMIDQEHCWGVGLCAFGSTCKLGVYNKNVMLAHNKYNKCV